MAQILALISRVRHGQGGVASYFRCLEDQLGRRVRYLSIGGDRVARTIVQRLWLLARDYRQLHEEMANKDLRVVHLNPSMVWKSFVREAVHLAACRAAGKKVLIFWHGWDWKFAQRLRRGPWHMIFARTYAHADCHMVLASGFRDHLRKLGCLGPVVLESTAVSEEIMRPAHRAPRREGEPLRLLFLSRVEKTKGIYIAIDAAADLRRAGHAVQLTIAGDGSERIAAEQYVLRRRLEGINFVGYVQGPTKAQIFANADVYLFPSNHGEGMPLSVIEAMAAGLPVICTRAGGLDDFFADQAMGYSVGEPSTAALVSRIDMIRRDPARAGAMGAYNRDYAARHFAAPVVARRLFAAYDFLMSDPPSNIVPADWMNDSQ